MQSATGNDRSPLPPRSNSSVSGVWLRHVLLAVAAFETLLGLLDYYELFDLYDATLSFGQFVIKARLVIHPLFAIAALVLATRRYLRAAMVVLAANILATLAIGLSPDLMLGLSLLDQLIFGPLAVTAIVVAVLDKFLWLGVVFVALPSATQLLGLLPLILFAIAVVIGGRAAP